MSNQLIPATYKILRKKNEFNEFVAQFYEESGTYIEGADCFDEDRGCLVVEAKFKIKEAIAPNRMTWKDVRG